MEPEDLLLCSQEPDSGPYAEPNTHSSHPYKNVCKIQDFDYGVSNYNTA
jgi:hypothetical protein